MSNYPHGSRTMVRRYYKFPGGDMKLARPDMGINESDVITRYAHVNRSRSRWQRDVAKKKDRSMLRCTVQSTAQNIHRAHKP